MNNLNIVDILIGVCSLVYFIVSCFINGFALLSFFPQFKNRKPLEIFVFSLAIGIPIIALFSLLFLNFNLTSLQVNIVFLLEISFVFFYLIRKRVLFNFFRNRIIRFSFLNYILILFMCIFFSLVEIKFPDPMIDGPYVFKQHRFHTKIQVLTGGLPADNFVPFVFSDFLIRGIDFKTERPMLPGQEVSNRTVMMGLVGGLFRKLSNSISNLELPLGKFEYVGSKWPDVGRMGFDSDYFIFFCISVAMNSLIVLGILLIAADFNKISIGVIAVLVMLPNPYFLSQIIFIWPKMLAGFYALIATREIIFKRDYLLAGLFIGLSFHSHPMAQIYFASIFLYLLYGYFTKRNTFKNISIFTLSFFTICLPWYFWTKIVLKINSDLFAQNFFNFIDADPYVNFVWIRIVNLVSTFFPTELVNFPFRESYPLYISMWSVIGAVGILFFIQQINVLKQIMTNWKSELFFFALLPIGMLTLTFGTSNRFTVHGLQPHIVFFVFLTTLLVFKSPWRKYLFISQFVFSVLSWAIHLRGFSVFEYEERKINYLIILSLLIFLTSIGRYIIYLSNNKLENC